MDSTKKSSRLFKFPSRKGALSLLLLAVGLVLITLQLLFNVGNYFRSAITQVDYPVTYRFPAFDSILSQFVKDDLVDYQGIARSPEFNEALKELARTSPDRLADPSQQLAFWINGYNLLTIKNVLDHYPITTVRNIAQKASLRKFIVGGQPYSLEEIESQKLRPLFTKVDPRAVFLVNGGAVGYPPLLDHAIEPERLPYEMSLAAFNFVNNPDNVTIDLDINYFLISRYFKWYEPLFVPKYGTPHEFVVEYLAPVRKQEAQSGRLTEAFRAEFNWWLNDTALKDVRKRLQGEQPLAEPSLELVP